MGLIRDILEKDRLTMEYALTIVSTVSTNYSAAKCLRGWIKCLMWLLLLLVDPALTNPGVYESGMLPIKITSSHLTVIVSK